MGCIIENKMFIMLKIQNNGNISKKCLTKLIERDIIIKLPSKRRLSQNHNQGRILFKCKNAQQKLFEKNKKST
jgi:hypothetical protein